MTVLAAFVLPLVVMLVLQFALPAYLIYTTWRAGQTTCTLWLLNAMGSAGYVTIIALAGRWDWFSYYFRVLLLASFACAMAAGYRRIRRVPWLENGRPGSRRATATEAFTLLVMIGVSWLTIRGLSYDEPPVQLTLPLRDGTYYVIQGGSSAVLNHHHTVAAQRYALDILQVNALGARASTVFSTEPRRYVIFGTPVYSPCDGMVVETVDGLSDHRPPERDPTRPAGNHVVVACQGARVVLAHLQRDSVSVAPGDHVTSRDRLALVGNSGNTSEPHLHVHAVRGDDVDSGTGVPIVFDGTFGVRNTLFRR